MGLKATFQKENLNVKLILGSGLSLPNSQTQRLHKCNYIKKIQGIFFKSKCLNKCLKNQIEI
jgi:hypothetical protein